MKTVIPCYQTIFKKSSLKDGDNYKYLGILEAKDVNTKKMKEKVKPEYLRRTKKFNSGNLFKAINTWTVSLFYCSAAFVGWTKEEISEIDTKTRKLLTMHKEHHTKGDVHRLYIKRKKEGR